MDAPDPILDLMDRFTAALSAHDLDTALTLVTDDIVVEPTSPPPMAPATKAARPSRRSGETCWPRPRVPGAVEEQFSDGSGRAVVCWRHDWGEGHVRGVDIIRVQDGHLA